MMKYYYKTVGDKKYRIPFNELKNSVEKLNISFDDAVQMWLEDNEKVINKEQEKLQEKASAVKVEAGTVKEKKPRKPREIKTSNAKKELFAILRNCFDLNELIDYEITTENKLFCISFEGKIFDLNLIEKRPPKK